MSLLFLSFSEIMLHSVLWNLKYLTERAVLLFLYDKDFMYLFWWLPVMSFCYSLVLYERVESSVYPSSLNCLIKILVLSSDYFWKPFSSNDSNWQDLCNSVPPTSMLCMLSLLFFVRNSVSYGCTKLQ